MWHPAHSSLPGLIPGGRYAARVADKLTYRYPGAGGESCVEITI